MPRDRPATLRPTPVRRLAAPLFAAAFLAGTGAGARADEALCLDGPREIVWAAAVERGDELLLVDGRRVRLADVEVPPPSLADRSPAAGAEATAIAAAAAAALADRVEGRELSLLDLGEDRRGRRRGHLVDTETGHWLNGDLVADGRVRVVPASDDAVCIAALRRREARARSARAGLWATAVAGVRPADRSLVARVGDVVVAEGVVRSIGRSGGKTWLNFGDDILRDFAVVMNDNDRIRVERAGLAPDRLRGRLVRVRGVVSRRGEAPRMAVDDPTAIEPVER